MSKSGHNARLKALLSESLVATERAESEADLLAVLTAIKEFGAPIKFNNRLLYVLAAVAALIGGGIGLFIHQSGLPATREETIGLVLLGALTVGAVGLGIWRNKSIKALADEIYKRDVILDNRFEPVWADPVQAAREMEARFRDFDRGNYSREIKALYSSHFKGRDAEFSYHYYQFHYVDQRQETSTYTDKNGNTRTRTRTVYDHYDRYGLYLPFKLAQRIFVIGKQMNGVSGYNYKPASIIFNRKFEIYAADEMTAAKLFKPAVVVAFEDALQHFKDLNCEINADGDLCLSFRHDILKAGAREGGFDDLDGYIREIKEHRSLPELDAALDLIETLMRHSDNNFKETGPWTAH